MDKTLLAIFAHPDDEAFGIGGTLTRYAQAGADVRLICATRGESGKITDPDIDPNSNVGELREQELKDACAAMGLEPPIFLDYHDSGREERTQHSNNRALMHVAEDELEAALLEHIADIKPQVMLTFDPHGIYGHIDHIKIHRATTAAFWAAGGVMQPAPRRLFYTVLVADRMKEMQEARPNSPLSKLDADIYGVSEDSLAAVLDVTPYVDQKEKAVKAHRSQTGPTSSFANISRDNETWREMFMRETVTLGGLRGSFPAMPVDDLFAGLD